MFTLSVINDSSVPPDISFLERACAMKYLNSIFLMLMFAAVALAGSGLAAAQDAAKDTKSETKQEEKAKQDQVMDQLMNNNPYLDKLHEASVAFIKDVPEDGVKTLYMIRESYGVIRSVHQVDKDVAHAVELCGAANEDLKGDIDARYKEWNAQVMEALGTQEKNLNAVIKKQAYKTEKEVRDYLKNIDAAAEYADKILDKRVVTTPEACNGLRDSMDKTGPNIVTLLGQLEMPPLDEDSKAVVEDKAENKGEETAE